MDILGLILLPIVFVFNSFFIGKLFFRKYKTLFGNYSFLLGWLSFIFIIGTITLPIYFVPKYIDAYKTILIIIQSLLFIIYLFNFRWFIISYFININKVIYFLTIILISTFFYLFFLFLKWNNNSINELINNHSIINKYYLFDDFITNFLSYFSSNKQIFYKYSLPIFFILLITTTIMSITKTREQLNIKRFISTIFITSLFSIIIFNNNTNFINHYSHLYLILFFSINFLITNFKTINFKNNYLIFNFSLLYLVIISNSFFIYSVILYLMFIITNYSFNRDFSFDYIINSFIYIILANAFSVVSNNNSIIFWVMISLFGIIIAIYYIFKKYNNYYEIIYKIDNFLINKIKYMVVLTLFIEIISIILLASRDLYTYDTTIFQLTFLFTENVIYQKIFLYTFYCFYGIIFLFSLLYFVINFRDKKNNKNYLFSICAIILLLYNPLTISIIYYINMLYSIDSYIVFLILFLLIYLILFRNSLKINYNNQRHFENLTKNKTLLRSAFYNIKNYYNIIGYYIYCLFSSFLVLVPLVFTFV